MDKQLTAGSEMLIRKSVNDVFEAFVDPEITTNFWFTKSSGRLESGKTVEWAWGQFGVSAEVSVTEIKQDRLIKFDWPSEVEGSERTVEISFEDQSGSTFVRVIEEGFNEDDEQLIKKIAGQTEGWALVLSALKAWLEHNINLNLISDHKPDV